MELEIEILNNLPFEIKNARLDDRILYVLWRFGPLKREILIKLMSKNRFHHWAKELKQMGFLNSEKDREGRSTYVITQSGLDELIRRIRDKNIDFDELNRLEQTRIKKSLSKFNKFFKEFSIYNHDIKVIFLELSTVINREKLFRVSELKFFKLLLFLALNHPQFYPYYNIAPEKFIEKYNSPSGTLDENLTQADINKFLQIVLLEQLYGDLFYVLDVSEDMKLYFLSSGEYGRYFENSVKSSFRKLYNLRNLGKIKLNKVWLWETYDKIVDLLIYKFGLFHPHLKDSLRNLLKNYKRKLEDEFKKSKIKDFKTVPALLAKSEIAISKKSKPSIHDGMRGKISYPLSEIEDVTEISDSEILEQIETSILENPSDPSNFLKKTEFYADKIHSEIFPDAFQIAMKSVDHGIGLSPDDISEYYKAKAEIYLYYYGESLDAGGYFEQALENIELALESVKNKTKIPFYLKIKTEMYLIIKDFDNALKSLELAFDFINDNPILDKDEQKKFYEDYFWYKAEIMHNLKKDEEVLEVLNKAIEMNFFNIVDKIFFYIYEIRNYDKALDIIDKLIEEDSKKSYFYLDLKAQVYFEQNRYQEAIDILDTLVELDPESQERYLHNKCSLLIRFDNFRQAIQLLDDFIILHPNDTSYYEMAMVCFEGLKMYRDALYISEKLIEMDQENKWYKYQRSYFLAKIGFKFPALQQIQKLIKNNPQDLESRKFLGWILITLGHYDDAIDILLKCRETETNPGNLLEINLSISKAYKNLEKFTKALEYVEKAKIEFLKMEKKPDGEEIWIRNYYAKKIDKYLNQLK